MKKIFSLLFLLIVGISAYAQKSYVTMMCVPDGNCEITEPYMYLTGDLPSSVSAEYTTHYPYPTTSLGTVITKLAESGFSIEHHSMSQGSSGGFYQVFIFSKPSSSSASKIERVATDSNEEVTEVARYNLQGIPVTEADKGLQIIVYSNYTTKTVLVE